MNSGLITALLGLVGLVFGSALTYILGKRRSSGKIETAEAVDVFRNMQELLSRYKIEVNEAKDETTQLKSQLIIASKEITTLREEMVVCRAEIQGLRLIIQDVELVAKVKDKDNG